MLRLLGFALKGWRLGLLSGGVVCYLAIFGLWQYAMETLSLLAAAVPISILIGIVLGTLAYKKKPVEKLLKDPAPHAQCCARPLYHLSIDARRVIVGRPKMRHEFFSCIAVAIYAGTPLRSNSGASWARLFNW